MKKNKKINIVEIIQNKSFRNWVRFRTDNFYWEDFATESQENAQLVEKAKSFLLTYNFDEEEVSEEFIEDQFEILIKKIYLNTNSSKRPKLDFSILIILIFIFSLGYILNDNLNFFKAELVEQEKTELNDQIILKTSLGKNYLIQNEEKLVLKNNINVSKSKGELDYTNNNLKDNKIEFHELIVPRGKRYNLVLSDGTKVYLNSGSALKYPVNFKKNGPREVYIEGEGFFDVQKSSNLFIINTKDIIVEVYGTKFNFKNYTEDENSSLVLVEGKVGLKITEDESIFEIKPGNQGIFSKNNKTFSSEHVNTDLYTSWINGEIIIRSENFDQITKKLERIFNVNIINKMINSDVLYNANINTNDETIEEVLEYFKEINNINYKIYDDVIIIN